LVCRFLVAGAWARCGGPTDGTVVLLERAREHEPCLQGCPLGATGLPPGADEVVPTPQLACLCQTLGHVRPSHLFGELVHEGLRCQ
jgi:hypothetical protein